MPSNLSSEAGRRADDEAGAFFAKSGTHVWKGNAPALVKLPISKAHKAIAPREVSEEINPDEILNDPLILKTIPIPISIIVSDAPIRIIVFFAAEELSSS